MQSFKPLIIIPSLASPTRSLRNLIHQTLALHQLFDQVPILILAQDWEANGWEIHDPLVTVKHCPRLGITPARQELRRIALETDATYFILTDDDISWGVACGHNGKPGMVEEAGRRYLSILAANPSGYGGVEPIFLKGFAVSRDLFEKVDFPNYDVKCANGYMRGFEDMLFVCSLITQWPEKRINLIDSGVRNLTLNSSNVSTWWDDFEKNHSLLLETYYNSMQHLTTLPNYYWLRDSDLVVNGNAYSCSIMYEWEHFRSINKLLEYYKDNKEEKK